MSDVKALIASARLPERSVAICLQPDLTAELQDLERRLEEADATQRASGSLAGGERVELAQQMEDVRARMKSHTVDFRLRALPRRRWTALVAEHPPRVGHERVEYACNSTDGDDERNKLYRRSTQFCLTSILSPAQGALTGIGSLVAEGLDGVEAGGFEGGNEAGE